MKMRLGNQTNSYAPMLVRPPLTDDSSYVVPHRQAVGLGLLPAVVVAQVEGEPEEEGVVDQLQTRVGQRVLRHKEVQSRNNNDTKK